MWSTGRRVIDTKSRKKSRLPSSLDFVDIFGNCGEQRAGKGLGREVAVIGPPDVRGDDLAALLHDDAVPPIMPAAGILQEIAIGGVGVQRRKIEAGDPIGAAAEDPPRVIAGKIVC